MKNPSEFAQFMLDQLAPLAPMTVKRMFGAECLFRHGKMFAIIDDDEMYVKANDETAHHFIRAGCEKFTYWTTKNGTKKQVALNYYQLPASALDDTDELCYWVGLGILASQTD